MPKSTFPLPADATLNFVFDLPVSVELPTGGTLTGAVQVTFYAMHDALGRSTQFGVREHALTLSDPQVVTTVKSLQRDESGTITGMVELPAVVPLR